METRYPAADWRPLGPQTEPAIVPRILVFHTMVGYLASTESMFRSGGYTGVESTFGVGGPWDGAALDGAVWQWQDLGHQADAQAAGNAYCTSIETSDGGQPSRPWSPAQLAALVDLTVWWCRQTGAPARLVKATTDRGIGYHRQFSAWNPNAHDCPGDVRLDQLLHHVIPTAAAALADPTPTEPREGTMYLIAQTDGPSRWLWTGAALRGLSSAAEVAALESQGVQRLNATGTQVAAWFPESSPVDVQALAAALASRLPTSLVDPVALAKGVAADLAARLQS